MRELAAIHDLVDLVTEKQFAADASELPYVGLEHIAPRSAVLDRIGSTEGIVGICNRFAAGDILFGKLRPNLRKCVQADRNGLCSTEILVLRPRYGHDPRFVAQIVRGEQVFRIAGSATEGTKMPRTSWGTLSKIRLFAPSLEEQRAIADVLDAVDAAIRETEALIAKLKLLRLGLIHDLIGNDHPVSALRELGRPGIPFVRTGPFGTTLQGIAWQESGVPVVPIAALDDRGIVSSRLDFVSPADAAKLASFAMREGDILFSRVADVGRCVVVTPEYDGWIMSSNLMRMTLDPDRAVPSFMRLVLSAHQDLRRQIRATVNAGGRDVINSAILAGLRTPLPSLTEQRSVVSTVKAVDETISAQEQTLGKRLVLRDGLRDDLLTGRVRVAIVAEAAA